MEGLAVARPVADCGVPGSLQPLNIPVTVLVDREDKFWKGCAFSCGWPRLAAFSFVTREADLAWRSWGNVSVIEHELGHASAITWKVMVDILASHFPGRVRSVLECVFV